MSREVKPPVPFHSACSRFGGERMTPKGSSAIHICSTNGVKFQSGSLYSQTFASGGPILRQVHQMTPKSISTLQAQI